MPGLRHNPAAPYCTKRVDLGEAAPPLEADARCEYCDSKGLGAPTVEKEDARPTIVRFFEAIGLVQGRAVSDVRTVDGYIFAGVHEIVRVHGLLDPATHTLDAVIVVKQLGTQVEHRIVWSKVASFH